MLVVTIEFLIVDVYTYIHQDQLMVFMIITLITDVMFVVEYKVRQYLVDVDVISRHVQIVGGSVSTIIVLL